MKNKKSKKNGYSKTEIWTEEQYKEYLGNLYDMEFIAGFTENGIPYGTFNDEDVEDDEIDIYSNTPDNDELPF